MHNNGNGGPRISWRSLGWPAGLLLAAWVWRKAWVAASAFFEFNHATVPWKTGEALPLLFGAAAVTLVANLAVQLALARRLKSPPSRMVRQLTGVAVWSITGAVLAGTIFEVPLGSVVTTSGMMVAVVGISLKNMISDLFTGLSLPVKIGNWIEVDGVVGKVVEVTWRATRMVTRDDVAVIIPNTHLMAKPFRNYSQPEDHYRDGFRITLPTTVTTHQAERNLTAAARQVDAIAALPFIPEARIVAFSDRGIEWELKYYVPGYEKASGLRFKVQRNLLRNLHFSGIELPKQTVEWRKIEERPPAQPYSEELAFLASVDLFGALVSEELEVVSRRMMRRLVRSGVPVVKQGDDGESLFVLREGLLDVSIVSEGIETTVGQITPGHFFGEMSLLTGASRSATVVPVVDSMVYEITREVLEPVMRNRPDIAEQMSQVLADRQSANLRRSAAPEMIDDARQSLAQQIFGRISLFFRLKPERLASE